MGMPGSYWVLFILLGFFLHANVVQSQNSTCHPDDLKALRGFLAGLNSGLPGWTSSGSDDCCSWDGVHCKGSDRRVVRLKLVDRSLRGPISESLSGLGQLRVLNLSHNFLNGNLPSKLLQLKNLDNLFYLDLSNNSLSGEVPRSLTQLKSLISRNNISHKNLPLDVHIFSGKNLSVNGLQYNHFRSFPQTLNLSDNNLNGFIWSEFGNLKELHGLDLSRNNLSGSIPDQLSGMTSIEVLDLSYNELSGEIPASLTNLSFLSRFDVSHNQLSGKVPDAGQFSTFPSSSYEENLGLCGIDQLDPCVTEIPSRTKEESFTEDNKLPFVPFAFGVVSGFLATVGMFAVSGKLF